jgi:hypothetical protein
MMLTIPGLYILDNDKDCAKDPISITSISKPANGHVTKNPDGGFRYIPDLGFVGGDTFTYEVSDSYGGRSSANSTNTTDKTSNDTADFKR